MARFKVGAVCVLGPDGWIAYEQGTGRPVRLDKACAPRQTSPGSNTWEWPHGGREVDGTPITGRADTSPDGATHG